MCYKWNLPIGIAGSCVGGLLTLYAVYKFVVFVQRRAESRDPQVYMKKMAFHILIILAAGLDIPLNISIATICDYNAIAYAFHKLQPPILFAALSVTVSIWSGVLYDLREFHDWPFFLRRVSLIAINVLFMAFGFSIFVTCFFYKDVADIAATQLYDVVYWAQIACSAAVTSVMLHLGLKLKQRIQGAAGPQDDSMHSRYSAGSAKPFKVALDRLTRVMGVCLFCVALQTILLMVNFIVSDPKEPDEYAFHPLVYWLFTNWVPQVGWVLALLYLCRTSQSGKTPASASGSGRQTEQQQLKSPLLQVSEIEDEPRATSASNSVLDGVFDDSILGMDEEAQSDTSRLHSRDIVSSEMTDETYQ